MKTNDELLEALRDIIKHPIRSLCELLGIALTFIAIIFFFSIW